MWICNKIENGMFGLKAFAEKKTITIKANKIDDQSGRATGLRYIPNPIKWVCKSKTIFLNRNLLLQRIIFSYDLKRCMVSVTNQKFL